MSHQARGAIPRRRLSQSARDRWAGISMFDTLEAAAAKGRESPMLGDHIAEVHIPPDSDVRIEQTGENPSHFTVWAPADRLLGWVTSVWDIRAVH